ncbi:MAG: hypothetical protein B6242_02400 [Anaerolineaceae bacterium 4572_78]|nr:MAG: hypothetical protein B6242_02400 [Anaerolineaceae bacterium 4572_78]
MITEATSDAMLLRQVQAGDEIAYEAFFHRHYRRIYTILYRLLGDHDDAEDMTQHIFIKLYMSPQRLQIDRDTSNIVGWLYRVAMNTGYNAIRSRKRRQAWHDKFLSIFSLNHAIPDPADIAQNHDEQNKVRQILAGMKPRDAKLLLLRHAGLSYKELATVLNVAPSSIGSLLTRAERKFRQRYEDGQSQKKP